MTIAAGFLCPNGVVLATDTAYTLGYLTRIQGPKIFRLKEREDVRLAIAGAGDVSYMEMAVEKIDRKLDNPAKGGLDHVHVYDSIENVITQLYSSHIHKCPVPDSDKPHFWLLIAVWVKGLGLKLIRTERTAICYVDRFYCHGGGNVLANYLLSPRYIHPRPWEETVSIAAYVLNETKSYVAGCGGETEILVLKDDGKLSDVASGVIKLNEKHVATLREHAELVIQESMNLRNDEGFIQTLLQMFNDAITESRTETRKFKDLRERAKMQAEEIKRRKTEQSGKEI